MFTQTLSFEVRVARARHEIEAACRVRAQAYGHHVPHLSRTLLEPDLLDIDENTVVVLCVDKRSGQPVGTARFQTNAGGPLLIEHSVDIPLDMRSDTRAEITRFSAVAGADPLVKLALMKTSYLFCMGSQIRWMIIGARNDALVRQYERLGFGDLLDDGATVPLLHAGRLEHHVMSFNVTAAERTWRELHHPLYQFMIETYHPDIQMFSQRPAMPLEPDMAGAVVAAAARYRFWQPPMRGGLADSLKEVQTH